MTRPGLNGLSSLVVLGVLLAAWSPAEVVARSEALSVSSALELHESFSSIDAPAFAECNAVCNTECGANPDEHSAGDGSKNNIRNPHSYCVGGANCSGHPSDCTGGGGESFASRQSTDRLRGLVAEVAAGSVQALHELEVEFRDRIRYNAARHAVQVFGCEEGAVTAHVPLNAKQRRVILARAD